MRRRILLVAILASGLLLVPLLGFRAVELLSRSSKGPTELLVYGIDGADWAVIDRLIARGELPHLASLIERGVRADLRTIEPMLSPRIWTTIATGKAPEKHGIKDFFATARLVRSRRVWDIAESAGLTVGVYGYPITWPPRAVEGGFMIPDWMAQGPETYPAALSFVKEMEVRTRDRQRIGLAQRIDFAVRGFVHGLRISSIVDAAAYSLFGAKDDLARYAALGRLQYAIQADLYLELHERYRPDVSVFYSDVVDKLSHRYWLFQDPTKVSPEQHELYGNVVEDAYRQADAELGRALATVGPETSIVVLSDHGFEDTDRLGVSRPALVGERTLALLGAGETLRAFTVTGSLYIRSPDPARTEEASRTLREAVHLPSGRPAFRIEPQVDRSFLVELAPELRFADADPVRIGDGTHRIEEFTRRRILGGGIHRDPGIFIMTCPACRRGEDIYELHVNDVTPTLLYLLDLPVGEDMDGRVALDAFARRYRDAHPVASVATHDVGMDPAEEPGEADEQIREMLRSVGYVE